MISNPQIDYCEEKLYMGIRAVVAFNGMFAEVDKLLKELRIWVKSQGLADEGPFFLRYYVIDMEGPMEIEVGFMVSEQRAATERIKPGTLPAGRYANLTYTGGGLKGNKALLEWVRDQGVVLDRWDDTAGDAFRCRYEAYLTHDRLQPRKSKGVDLAIKVADQ
jgi:effector-binding domain-containing protein